MEWLLTGGDRWPPSGREGFLSKELVTAIDVFCCGRVKLGLGLGSDGWNPAGVPLDGMAQMMGKVREMAKSAQRDPSNRSEPLHLPGTLEGCRRLQADEIFFDPVFSPDGNSLDRFLKRMEQLRALV
jgi:hypothetical protein